MTNNAKAKGSLWERTVAQYFRERGYSKVTRRFGAGQRYDTGDLSGIEGVCIEAKALKTITLASIMDEVHAEKANAGASIGVAVVKRRQRPVQDSYAVLTLADLVTLLAEAGY